MAGGAGFVQKKTLPAINNPSTVVAVTRGDIKATLTSGATPGAVSHLLEHEPFAPALQIVDLRTSIEITWYRPTRNVTLHFRTSVPAHRACDKVTESLIDGFQLRATVLPMTSHKSFPLQVSNVPDCISDEQLTTLLVGPRLVDIKSGKSSYTIEYLNSNAVIERVVNRVSSKKIKAVCIAPCKNQLRLRAEVSFDGIQRLDQDARLLDDMRVMEFGHTKISAVERVVVKFRLRQSLYTKHVGRLKFIASEIWRKNKIQISINDTIKEPLHNVAGPHEVELVIRGTSRAALTSAKAELDATFIQDVAGRLSVARRPRQTHRIQLTRTNSYKKVQTNIADVKLSFGMDVVNFDEESDPPAVVVTGDKTTLRMVQTALSLHTNRTKPMCTICEDTTDEVVRTRGCDHIACHDCFLAYCTTDVESKLPLRCFAIGCAVLIPMDQLRSQLPQADCKSIIDQAVYRHLECNVDTFGQCPGIDCEARFPINRVKDKHICPKCFTVGCPKCKVEYHYGETCEERARSKQRDEEKMQSWLKTANAKQCPSCGTYIEKRGGCNHMVCVCCTAHFCWLCMHTSPTQDGVYHHLQKVHGGYFDNEEEEHHALRRFQEEEDNELLRFFAARGVADARRLHQEVIEVERILDEQREVAERAQIMGLQRARALEAML